jgi:hypothetical protein
MSDDYSTLIARLRSRVSVLDVDEAADALEARGKRIDELESRLIDKEARIAELKAAGNLVVEWWLTEGMKVMNGAPYAMFKLRAALENTK